MTEVSDEAQSERNEGSDDQIPMAGHSAIQPLDDLEAHDFDMKSPVPAREPPRRREDPPAQRVSSQSVQVPAKFRALVEVMKSFGKAMVSLSDLERELKNWFAEHGEQAEAITTYLAKAADAQVVVVDKSINYVRFRNRSLAKSPIEYV